MALPTLKMLWLTMIFAGLAVVTAGEAVNRTSSASPKVQMSTSTTTTTTPTTTPPPAPPRAAVMDIFQAPLAAFKPKMEDKNDIPMGRDQQGSPVTEAPANIFFQAGNGIGQATSSLTGWLNNRLIPQALRPRTTTAAPAVFAMNPNQQINRRIVVVQENRRKPQRIRQRPILDDFDETEDDVQLNSYDGDDLNSYSDGYDEEEDYEPVQKRKALKKTQKRPNNQYYYIEEELGDSEDLDYDFEIPIRKPQRKQQNLNNRRRKTPPSKKQQKKKKPQRKLPNSQVVQVVQSRPQQTQIKRKKRPSTTFELVPISQNQAISSIQKKKPNSSSQNNKPKPVSQFLSIPWSRLGLSGPPSEQSSDDQQSKPIIVQIPQQNIKRKRRPMNKPAKVTNPNRKPLRNELQNQAPVFSLLSENQIREIFQNQPSNPSQAINLPVMLDSKKKENQDDEPSNNNSNDNNDNDTEQEVKPSEQSESENQNHEENENTNASYIVVGQTDDDDDKEIDLNLYRHFSNRRGFKRGRASPRINHSWFADDDYDE